MRTTSASSVAKSGTPEAKASRQNTARPRPGQEHPHPPAQPRSLATAQALFLHPGSAERQERRRLERR
jgi:hypothetical protein